jgi:hypothetical protein
MICKDCREGSHSDCPELDRQLDVTLQPFERVGSSRCDCQHEITPGRVLRVSS